MTPPQHVRIVGTGLLGASIGIALRTRGVEVSLADISPVSMALAADLGAGRRHRHRERQSPGAGGCRSPGRD